MTSRHPGESRGPGLDTGFRRYDRGSVLIVSLWMVTILTLLALAFVHRTGVELRLTAYQWDEMRLLQGAEDALFVSRREFRRRQGAAPFGALNQAWSQAPGVFKDHPVPGGGFTVSHRAGEETLYGLEDEAGRINVNTAPPDVLERLFGGAAPAVLDWRDADDERRPGGAEKSDYGSGAPRNGPFQSVEELLLVKGVTPSLYRQVQDLVTVDGNGQVNLNTASPAALAALGLGESLAVKIAAFRRGPDGKEGTGDDGVFSTADGAPGLLAKSQALSTGEAASLSGALGRGLLTARAGALRLNVLARLEDGRSSRAFTIVVPAGAPVGVVLHWREGA
jgi:hypothetical protein